MYAKCKSCGLLFDPDYLRPKLDYVEQEYIDLRRYLEHDAGILFFAYLVVLLEAALPNSARPRFRLLEIGSGPGFIVDIANFTGAEAQGIEPCRQMVEWARTTLGVKIEDGYFGPETQLLGDFDAVLSTEVLEHIPKPNEFLRAIADRLRPAGVLLLTTPNADSRELAERVDKWIVVNPDTHPLLYSEASLRLVLTTAGFSDVAILPIEGPHKSERLLGVAGKGKQGTLARRLTGEFNGWASDSQRAVMLAISYLQHLTKRFAVQGGPIWEGAMARTVEYLTNLARYSESAVTADMLDAALTARGLKTEVIEKHLDTFTGAPVTLFDTLPWYMADYSSAKALAYALTKRFEEAERGFRIARKTYQIIEASAVALESSYIVRSLIARYHEGYTMLLAGDAERALEVFEELAPVVGSLPGGRQVDLEFHHAEALFASGQFREAIARCQSVLRHAAVPTHLVEGAQALAKRCLHKLENDY